MSDDLSLDQMSFHDCTILFLERKENAIIFSFEYVGYKNRSRSSSTDEEPPLISFSMILTGVTFTIEDGKLVDNLGMRGAYGGIIDLEHMKSCIAIVLTWQTVGQPETVSSFQILGDPLVVEFGPFTYHPEDS